MAVISFSFTSLHAEIKQSVKGRIKIGNNVTINSVDKADINFADASKMGVKVGFEYKSSYDPDIGNVVIKGNVVYLHEAKKVQELLDVWAKDKKIPTDAAKEVMTAVLDRSNIEALILSRDVGLPSPVPLPKVGTAAPKSA